MSLATTAVTSARYRLARNPWLGIADRRLHHRRQRQRAVYRQRLRPALEGSWHAHRQGTHVIGAQSSWHASACNASIGPLRQLRHRLRRTGTGRRPRTDAAIAAREARAAGQTACRPKDTFCAKGHAHHLCAQIQESGWGTEFSYRAVGCILRRFRLQDGTHWREKSCYGSLFPLGTGLLMEAYMRCMLGLCLAAMLGACGDGAPPTRGNASDGELVCVAFRSSEIAASCSVDNSRRVIFATIYTSSSEASKMCPGMLSEMSKVGVTGWRLTIRALSGQVLATCA